MQEALLWHKERNGVRCELCAKNCFIPKDKLGYCLVRKNEGNKLFTLNFGKLEGMSVDAVEKKPLYHFYPGSTSLSISLTPGSTTDEYLEQWAISHDALQPIKKEYSPEDIVDLAEQKNVKSISFTFFEPIIHFEFVYRVVKLAKRNNIKNVLVTNGYATDETIKKIAKYLDAVVVNFKASGDSEFLKNHTILSDDSFLLSGLRQMKKQRIHIEITNTIVPQIGDDVDKCRKLAEWINAEINSDVPFHIMRFYPEYKLMELPPTPMSTLEKCIDVSRKAGLRYVYIGNVPSHPDQNTICYNCREPIIVREGKKLKKMNVLKDRCQNCGLKISIVAE